MTTVILILIAAVVIVAAYLLISRHSISRLMRFRGTRVITCPETEEPAAVEVDALHAAASPPGEPDLRLKECSRWPEREDCGQECILQIEAAPESCLVRNMLQEWYQDKVCLLCKKPLAGIEWHEHAPAIMNAERKTLEWKEVRPEKIPGILESHLPICWDCHVAETFRRKYPDLVVERDWRRG